MPVSSALDVMMQNFSATAKAKTWDGLRGLFILLSVLFTGILAWLVFHESMLENDVKILLLIPAVFLIGCLMLALLASDQKLRKVAAWFCVNH